MQTIYSVKSQTVKVILCFNENNHVVCHPFQKKNVQSSEHHKYPTSIFWSKDSKNRFQNEFLEPNISQCDRKFLHRDCSVFSCTTATSCGSHKSTSDWIDYPIAMGCGEGINKHIHPAPSSPSVVNWQCSFFLGGDRKTDDWALIDPYEKTHILCLNRMRFLPTSIGLLLNLSLPLSCT